MKIINTLFFNRFLKGQFLELNVPFNPQAKRRAKSLQFSQAESPPFVVVVVQNAGIAVKDPALLVIFGSEPGASAGRIEKFADDKRVMTFLL